MGFFFYCEDAAKKGGVRDRWTLRIWSLATEQWTFGGARNGSVYVWRFYSRSLSLRARLSAKMKKSRLAVLFLFSFIDVTCRRSLLKEREKKEEAAVVLPVEEQGPFLAFIIDNP